MCPACAFCRRGGAKLRGHTDTHEHTQTYTTLSTPQKLNHKLQGRRRRCEFAPNSRDARQKRTHTLTRTHTHATLRSPLELNYTTQMQDEDSRVGAELKHYKPERDT